MRVRTLGFLSIAVMSLWLCAIAGTADAQQLGGAEGDKVNAQPCVVVMGAVPHTMQVELRRPLRLMESLFLAGGLTEAAGENIKIVHSTPETKCVPIPYPEPDARQAQSYSIAALQRDDESANPYLQAGDVIIAVELPCVYVIGYVVNPRAVYLKKPITLTQALVLAGGLAHGNRADRIKIYRRSPGSQKQTTITVDLKKIKYRQAADPVLEAYDIVDVPGKGNSSDCRLLPCEGGIVP